MQVFPLNHLQSAVHLHAVSPMQMRLFIMAAEHNWGFPHWNNHSAVSDRPLCQLDMKKTPRWESTSSAQDDADMGTCQWQDARSLVQSCPVFRRESKSSDIESHRIPAQLCSGGLPSLGLCRSSNLSKGCNGCKASWEKSCGSTAAGSSRILS